VAAAVSILTFINTFNCGQFIAHSLQLPDGEEPDWSNHFAAAFHIQVASFVVAQLVAFACWHLTAYRPVALLLSVGAIGLLIDWPNRIGGAMLWRSMDFRRLRIIHAISTALSLAVSVALGLLQLGAFAIVIGSNVAVTIPFATDLLVVRRWRPAPSWWRGPDWRAYRPSVRFGLQQAGTAFLGSLRDAATAVVLPGSLGFLAMGLLSRAQGLFSTTVGKVESVVADAVYPVLPRYAADRASYPDRATRFVQTVYWMVAPAAIFIGLMGPTVSRVLYGHKWEAMDPLIWPAAIGVLGAAAATLSRAVLLATSRLGRCLVMEMTGTCLIAPTVLVAWFGAGLSRYAWALGIAQLVAGGIYLGTAALVLAPGWWRRVLLPPALGAAASAGAVLGARHLWWPRSAGAQVAIAGLFYGIVFVATLRILFAKQLAALLDRLPGGRRVNGWLRLPSSSAVSATSQRPVR
jgi:O-antigen/teichoic acid export membrane protein